MDAAVVRRDGDAFDAAFHKFGGDFGLVLAHVVFAEEKLPVEVGYVNGICGRGWMRYVRTRL